MAAVWKFSESMIIRTDRSEEHTSELQSQSNLVCRLLLEKKERKLRHRHALAGQGRCLLLQHLRLLLQESDLLPEQRDQRIHLRHLLSCRRQPQRLRGLAFDGPVRLRIERGGRQGEERRIASVEEGRRVQLDAGRPDVSKGERE